MILPVSIPKGQNRFPLEKGKMNSEAGAELDQIIRLREERSGFAQGVRLGIVDRAGLAYLGLMNSDCPERTV
jgi:hypothetical protein